jgi:hypothetical protein
MRITAGVLAAAAEGRVFAAGITIFYRTAIFFGVKLLKKSA